MKNLDYHYLCTTIGNLTGIPIRLYANGQLIFYHAIVTLPKDPMCLFQEEILGISANVGYFTTPFFNYYGIVNSAPYQIVLGPSRQVAASEHELRELAFRCDVPADETDDFLTGMNSILRMPLSSILQILCTMNYVMNDEKLKLSDITIYDTEQRDIKGKIEEERAIQGFDAAEVALHNTLALEQTMLNIVRKGAVAALKEWIATAPAIRGGVLASNQLRQLKNTFVVTATLVSRAAIRGGMDAEDALTLSDSYIQKCELLNSMERIHNLQYHMVFDYTERVETLRLGKAPSKLALEVVNYVHHHLSEPINTEQLAKSLFMSRSHLSTRFKAETGETLVDFILKEKTEEAKRLLRYTDKSLSAITIYLGFSSQSHFTRVFRKYTGSAPKEYREKHA